MALDLLELRTQVKTILSDENYLGQYQWGATSFTPAIIVLPDKEYGYNFPPNNVTANKIEAVIMKPKIKNQDLLGGDTLQKIPYEIFLKQWETLDNNSMLVYPLQLREATQHLYEQLKPLIQVTNPFYPGKDESMGILEYSMFTAYCHQICVTD